jgi:hypothetical protein
MFPPKILINKTRKSKYIANITANVSAKPIMIVFMILLNMSAFI